MAKPQTESVSKDPGESYRGKSFTRWGLGTLKQSLPQQQLLLEKYRRAKALPSLNHRPGKWIVDIPRVRGTQTVRSETSSYLHRNTAPFLLVQWHSDGMDRVGKLQGARVPGKKNVHVGESCNRFADFGLWIAQKRVWRPGSDRTRWRSYSAPPDPPAVLARGVARVGLREDTGKIICLKVPLRSGKRRVIIKYRISLSRQYSTITTITW